MKYIKHLGSPCCLPKYGLTRQITSILLIKNMLSNLGYTQNQQLYTDGTYVWMEGTNLLNLTKSIILANDTSYYTVTTSGSPGERIISNLSIVESNPSVVGSDLFMPDNILSFIGENIIKASSLFPWPAGAGGVIILDEPLSIEELQTGALVLLMTRNGQPCEAVGVVNLRSVGVINDIQFYAYGRPVAEVATGASETDITNGVFQIRITDNSAQWQIVSARIDRQYWHGGALTGIPRAISSAGSTPSVGEEAVAVVNIGSGGSFTLSANGVAPLGGVWDEGIYISDGGRALSDYDVIELNTPSFTPEYLSVKAIFVIDGNLNLSLRVLYPNTLLQPYEISVFTDEGQDMHYDDTQSPWVLYVL